MNPTLKETLYNITFYMLCQDFNTSGKFYAAESSTILRLRNLKLTQVIASFISSFQIQVEFKHNSGSA